MDQGGEILMIPDEDVRKDTTEWVMQSMEVRSSKIREMHQNTGS